MFIDKRCGPRSDPLTAIQLRQELHVRIGASCRQVCGSQLSTFHSWRSEHGRDVGFYKHLTPTE